MKIVIAEDKRNEIALRWLHNNYSNLRRKWTEDSTYAYSKDGETYFILQPQTDKLWVSKAVWATLKEGFGYRRIEIMAIIMPWFSKQYETDVNNVELFDYNLEYQGHRLRR